MIVKLIDILKSDCKELSELPNIKHDRGMFLKERIKEIKDKISNGILEEEWTESQWKTFISAKKNHESLIWWQHVDLSMSFYIRSKDSYGNYAETK